MLAEEDWALVDEASDVLDLVQAAVAKLQGDHALLASYLPVTCGLRRSLTRRATPLAMLYVAELDGVERRNLDAPLRGKAGARWGTFRALASCAALAHPRHRSGWFLEEAEREAMAASFWQHCLTVHMDANGIPAGDEEQLVEVSTPIANPARPRRRLRGMAELEAAMGQAHR